jgi:hypothetical protein
VHSWIIAAINRLAVGIDIGDFAHGDGMDAIQEGVWTAPTPSNQSDGPAWISLRYVLQNIGASFPPWAHALAKGEPDEAAQHAAVECGLLQSEITELVRLHPVAVRSSHLV